jgi:hypothetical protein
LEFINLDISILFGKNIIIILYINNLFITRRSQIIIKNIKENLNKIFKIINLNLYTYYFEIDITRDRSNYIL